MPSLEDAFRAPLHAVSWTAVGYVVAFASALPIFARVAEIGVRKAQYLSGFNKQICSMILSMETKSTQSRRNLCGHLLQPYSNESLPPSVSVSGKQNFAGQRRRRRKGPVTFNRSLAETKPRTKTHQFGAICTTPGNL
jgi:hypothetical protein